MWGWLVVNRFLHTEKFTEHTSWFLHAAKKQGISLSCKTNAEIPVMVTGGKIMPVLQEELPDFVLFWDKDIRLAKALEKMGVRLYNRAEAVYACDDKYETFYRLSGKGDFLLPVTIPAPMTYDNVGYHDFAFLDAVIGQLGFPMVVKECFGSFGMQVHLAGGRKELVEIVGKIGAKPMVFQQYIAKSRGKDLRLQVVGDEVVCAMLRESGTGDFRANLTLGGRMQAYEPSEEECALAVAAAKALELDFAGVDLLMEDDRRYVCEVNSNAHFKKIADCTGVDVAEAIMSYIARCHGKTPGNEDYDVSGTSYIQGM